MLNANGCNTTNSLHINIYYKEGIYIVEFVSYNGEYPNLCSGTLTVKIDGEKIEIPPWYISSGGCVTYNNGDFDIEYGAWKVDVPESLLEYQEEIEQVMNENVQFGCCGGCI